ncbi:MAG: hypothetical protein HQL56_14970, partial [Magnetococcales bacterium]|nr:hypothetical protein [Magnetococcales bacterium]
YGNAGQIDEARGLYEAIATLARDHDGEGFLREIALARATLAMTYFLSTPLNLGGKDETIL